MPYANELPFSARYALPVQVSANLGEVSWESVVQLSTDFQAKTDVKRTKVRRIIKELQMSRLILLDRIRRGTKEGRIDPGLLVDVVKLLQRCEEVAEDYDLDLKEFSTYLYLVTEKLKKEKLAKHEGNASIMHAAPMKEGMAAYGGLKTLPSDAQGRRARKSRKRK
jgi:hypothetical protein